jgi:isoleucyl-tRNA synthetase
MTRFRQVPVQVDFPALERATLQRWLDERTFERSIEARRGRTDYVFYDGPPFATGLPHYGHILTSYIKDVVPRYFTMRGYHVPRRWGWDCHGLPVEYELEKELDFRNGPADIIRYGIDKFNEACKSTVLRHASEWRRIVTRLGRWVDFDNDYKTMDPDYMESVVWIFKKLFDKGLVYEGQKVVAFCTRCQTVLSNFEARQDDAFRPKIDPAISVKFRWQDDPKQAFVVWTTTPWTLISNVAVALSADAEYVAMQKDGETLWLAEPALARYKHELDGYCEVDRKRGRELAGTRYRPPFPYFADNPKAFVALTADFVTTEDGTGIVHMAPSFGEDDSLVCGAAGISGPNPVNDEGRFDASVPDFAGQHVFEANDHIIKRLKHEHVLVRRDNFEHNYPHCWRCDTPLIYRAIKTWFVEVTKFKQSMIAANQKIRWVPEHIRDGRFGNWLENARDWAVSRNRFWGSPIPVWRCNGCGALEVIGSGAELSAKWGKPITDWHRPAIDEPHWPCAACKRGTLRRVTDVFDCWFESGAMPYAQGHYPFANKEQFEASFPGDFIVEYIAQTRGWFYTMVAEAAALFDGPPFRNVVCHGVILAEDGRKMSKRLKNYPDPLDLVEAHGSDALRVALLQSAVTRGADIRFSGDSARDAVRRFSIPLWNSLHFFTAYAAIDNFEPRGEMKATTRLDRYLLSETDRLRETIERCMEAYDFASCYDAIEDYLEMLSTWYIRLSKQRLWQSGASDDKLTGFEVLYATLTMFAKMIAPFLPYLAEEMHAVLGGTTSVHLEDWPKARPEWRDDVVADEMRAVRTIVRVARNIREEHKSKHRHPLPSVSIAGVDKRIIDDNLELLLDELNVKEVKRLANVAEHVQQVVKLDYTRLGKRLRGDVKKVQAAINAGQYELSPDGATLRAAGVELGREDFSFRYVTKEEGTGVGAENDLVVLLDLHRTPELIVEGHARDLNRGVQDLRKDAGLAYSDRIRLAVAGPPPLVASLKPHFAWLAEQTLAVEIGEQLGSAPLKQETVELGEGQDKQTLTIALARA